MPTGRDEEGKFDWERNNEYFINQFIPKVMNEIEIRLQSGVLTQKEANQLEDWLQEIDGGNGNFSADGRVLDYYDTTDLFEDGYDA